MYCTNCGNLNSNNDKFCKKCGTNLNNNVQNQVNQSNVVIPNVNQGINNNNVMIQNVNGNVDVSKKKVNKKIIFLTVGGVVLLLVVILVIVLVTSKNKNNGGGNNIVNTNKHYDNVDKESFFFMNDDGKYALFSADGDKLSDFIYSSGDDFLYGSALVSNEADQEAIISSSGKILVDFEENTILARYGPFYEKSVFSPSYNTYLIDSNGKILYDLDNYNIVSSIGASRYIILEDEVKNKYIVLNYLNEKILEIPLSMGADDIEIGLGLSGVGLDAKYVSLFYNKKNYIVDFVGSKVIVSFDSDKMYCVNNVSNDGSIMLLNSCSGFLGFEMGNIDKVLSNDIVYDVPDKCEEVVMENNNLICTNKGNDYVLNSKMELSILVDDSNVAYIDGDNYIKNSEKSGVDFYSNGKFVKNVSCRSISNYGYISGDVYALSFASGKGCKYVNNISYFDKNGNKIFESEFIDGTHFDENDMAVVKKFDSDKNEIQYLIDKQGNKVSNNYREISKYENGFYGIYDGNFYGFLDGNGKEIIPCKYINWWIAIGGERKLLVLVNDDSKYEIFNPVSNKVILILDSVPDVYEEFIAVYKDDKRTYYGFNGKLIYQS